MTVLAERSSSGGESPIGRAPTAFGTPDVAEYCLLALVTLLPFTSMLIVNYPLIIPGLKLPLLLSFVFLGVLAVDPKTYRFSDPIELRAVIAFGMFVVFSSVSFERSLQNLDIFHAIYPAFYPDDSIAYTKNQFVEPFAYASSFLFIVKRMNNAPALLRLFAACTLGITAFSALILLGIILEPEYLITAQRAGMTYICEKYVAMHYTDAGSLLAFSCPPIIYMAIKKGGWYRIAYFIVFAAVVVVQARTSLYAFLFASLVALIALGRSDILLKWVPAIGTATFFALGSVVISLFDKGFTSHSGFNWFEFLSGRDTAIWLPLVVEWMASTTKLLWGAGFHGMLTSFFLRSGVTLPVAEAHNAYLEFFLDNGILLTVVLIVLLLTWLTLAVRLGRRLSSGTYWVMLLCPVVFLLTGFTGRHFFPNLENVIMFPILGAFVNAARLSGNIANPLGSAASRRRVLASPTS